MEIEIARIIGLISLLIFVGGIAERLMKKPNYALHLETNAGSQKLISSSDKNFIQKIIGQIYSFMAIERLLQNAKKYYSKIELLMVVKK